VDGGLVQGFCGAMVCNGDAAFVVGLVHVSVLRAGSAVLTLRSQLGEALP
jgi:hypothetical protein